MVSSFNSEFLWNSCEVQTWSFAVLGHCCLSFVNFESSLKRRSQIDYFRELSDDSKFRVPGVPVCLPARRVPTPGDFPERTQKKPALAQNNPPAERAGREASSRGGYKIARCYVTRWRFQRKPRTALGQVDELPTVQWRCVP